MRSLILLVNDYHVDNYLKEILAFAYYCSIVNNLSDIWSKNYLTYSVYLSLSNNKCKWKYFILNLASELFYHNSLDRSISNRRSVRLVFIITTFFLNNPILVANSVDPDQTP